jgi:hypothetical protein
MVVQVLSPSTTLGLRSCPDGILPPGKVDIFLSLLERLERLLVLRPMSQLAYQKVVRDKNTYFCQPPPDGTSFLRPQIKWKVFLILVILPEVLACFLVGYSEHTGDRLAHSVAGYR